MVTTTWIGVACSRPPISVVERFRTLLVCILQKDNVLCSERWAWLTERHVVHWQEGITPLHVASHQGQTAGIRALLAAKADVHAKDLTVYSETMNPKF